MEQRCAELRVPLAVAALAFNYTEPLVDVTVPGMTKPQEIEQNVTAFAARLTREQLESIADAGKIDPALLGGPEFLSPWPADRRPNLR
jgi:aryl-alcohol dehydrogenase-like predicted oxidoreductase